jgi:hypothetical protein
LLTKVELKRVLAKIDYRGECWVWNGALAGPGYDEGIGGRGYPQAKLGGKVRRVHRAVYEHFHGPIPERHDVDHTCRLRQCLNPEHLEAVPHRENLLRGDTITRHNAAVTACPKGHPYSGPNLYVDPRGHRQCRECRRAAQRRVA